MVDLWADQQFIRYPIQLPFLCQTADGAVGGTQVGWTRNLSEGGACLHLAKVILPRTSLWVLFQTDGDPIAAKARVVWTGEAGIGLIPHGVAFTQIAPDQRESLWDLIRSRGQVRPGGIRLPLDLSVTCWRKRQARSLIRGRTANVSRGGLLLCLADVLVPATALVITLHTAAGPLTTEGATVWVAPRKRRTPKELIRHGVQLSDHDVSLALARLLTGGRKDRFRSPRK